MASTFSVTYILLFNIFFTGYGVRGGRNNPQAPASQPHSNTITTIETLYGDIYDCVEVEKQYSLTHPALRGHKIRMRPSQELLAAITKNMTMGKTYIEFNPKNLWKLGEGCPKGTVPIQRSSYHSRRNQNLSQSFEWKHGVEFAGIRNKPGKTFTGASAIFDIQDPKVGANQYSASMISVENGGNRIQVGWIVNPKLYGDYHTRLYTFWTSDNHVSTGCYNTLCKGFVMVDNTIPLGFIFTNDSDYEGLQYEYYMFVFLDPKVGWWLYVHDWLHPVGYWPLSLFTPTMHHEVTSVRFGGEVFTPMSEDNSPQMGSGRYVDGEYEKTCYMRQVVVLVSGEKTATSPDNSYIDAVESRCYFAGDDSYKPAKQEYSFMFGGTGGKDEVKCVY